MTHIRKHRPQSYKRKLSAKNLFLNSSPAQNQGSFKLGPNFFLFFLMILVFLGCFAIIRPYIHSILLATILSFVTSPVHERIENLLGRRKNIAAFVSCLLLTIVVVIPLSILVLSLIQQGVLSFNAMYDWIAAGKYEEILKHPVVLKAYELFDTYLPDIRKVFPGLNLTDIKINRLVMDATANMGKLLLNQGGHLMGNIGALIVSFFLMLFTFFFLIRDEKRIWNRILHVIPLTNSQETQIIGKIQEIARSVLLGTFVTSLTQGFAGGIAFYICGLPGLFWGMVMSFASLIPMVGTSLVWVPAALYLLISGKPFLALFLVIWCIVVVGGIDNFIRPLFMQNGSKMNTLLIFFSILGGIHNFGLLGLLYGPLLFGLALVLLYIYSIEFKTFLYELDQK